MNNPTLVMASLDDKELQQSIQNLVNEYKRQLETMKSETDKAVKYMQMSFQELGNLKIDTGGSSDGGTGRRTQQHEKLTKTINDASEAVSKETQKLQDLQQSLSGASDREQNFISQKERAANTIAQENELLQRQEQELANLKNQQSSFSGTNQQTTASIDKQRESIANLKNEVKYWQSVVSQIQSGDKKARFNQLWIGDTTSKQGHDILDVANKLYSIMQKLGMETEKGSASTGQAVKVVEQLAKYYKISREEAEKLVMSVQESPLARGKFTTHYDTRFGLDNLTMQKKDAEDSALRLMIAQSKLERQTDDLALANKRLADSENSSTQASQQKAQIDAQVVAKEKEIAETKGRIAAATKEQSEADKNASQAAKEKANIQSQVANQEKQVAEAKKQLITATQQQAEVEKQSVQNIAQQTVARDRQIKKEKEINLTLDQRAEIMGRIPREMRMPDMAKSARESFQAFYKGFNEQARQLGLLVKSWESLLQSRKSSGIEQIGQQIRNVKHEISELIKEQNNLSKTKPQGYLDEIAKRNVQIKALRDQLSQLEVEQQRVKASDPFKNNPYLDSLRERLQSANNAMRDTEMMNKRLVISSNQLTEAQRKAVEEQTKLFYARTMKIPTDQYDMQIVKLERIQSLLERYRRGEVSFTPAQVSGLEKEERNLISLIGNVRDAQQQVTVETQHTIQFAQQYSEEIRKQAQAIRESQQWKDNKGFVTIDNTVLSDQESLKKNRISLEEQILRLQQQGVYLQQDQTTKEWQLVDASGKRVAMVQQENENLASLRERVTEASREVRRLFSEGNFGKVSFSPAPLSGVRYIYQENDERAKGLTIEQQIEKILKEQSAEYERQVNARNSGNSGSQRTVNDLQAQARAIEDLLEKGKHVKALGGFEFFHSDMSGLSVMQQIISYQQQRQIGLLAENQALNLQLELSNAIAQAQGKITNSKKYVAPTIDEDYYLGVRRAVANKLGIDISKVINADAQYDSIKRVGDALKQLQDAYTRMTNEERNSPIGKQMIRQMQELQRQSQQLRAKMSRPISLKDALSGSEKTLDDIAYKIRRLQSYMQGLDTSNEKSAAEFQRAALSANLLKEKQNQLLQKNSQLIRSNGELFKSNTALGRSWNYMKNRLAFYFTVGASTQFVKQLIDIRSQYEMNERALGILINSAERGTQIFNELSQMALVSPYTLIELSNAAKQLTAYDVAAKDVVDTTRRLADMASAVGVPMERLTYALGQIKAYGYLNSRDNRMFANAGIPLVKQLSDYYTELEGKLVSTADVYDRIKKKAVSFEDTMGVIYKMTDEGGKFFDFQEKMAGTLKVQLANLNLAWNNMLNDMGSESQGVLTTGIGALKNLFLAWKDIEKVLTQIIIAFGVVKGAQMLSTVAIGKQTIKTLEYVSANKLATASEYKRALSINGLNAEQTRWLILTNQSNKALITAITRMGVLDKAFVRLLATTTGFRKGLALLLLSGKMAISGLIEGFKTLGTAILSNWPMVLLMAGMDLFMHMNQVAKNNKELNKTIADGAKEATKALNDFLTAEDKVQIRLDAQNKTLTQAQGEKAWESIREQIELSAMSAKQIVPELLDIPDINDRITKSFEFAEKIQKATEALQSLEDELEVSQDSWLWGAFGEGLEEDIEDYVERINAIKQAPLLKDASWWQKLTENTKQQQKPYLAGDLAEAKSEIEDFANDAAEIIKERLGEGIEDPIQVGEAVERFIKETEAKYPKITRGAGKKLFEAIVSDTMGEQFKGVYDAQEQYYKLFLEQLGKDYGSKFRDVTEDIKKDTFDWSEAQEDAINKTAEKIKQDLPKASQDAIDQILKQLNTTEFKMRIVAEFATKTNDEVQKAFERDFYDRETTTLTDEQREKKRAENVRKYQAFRIKTGEDTVEYEKRISDEREKQEKLAKKTQAIIDKGGDSAVLARAKEENDAANKWLANMKEVEKWGGYDFSKDKKGNKKDPLLDLLKDVSDIIKKTQSEFDTLTQKGESSGTALDKVYGRYSKTLKLINAQLRGFGLPEVDLSKLIKGKNPNQVLEFFQKMSEVLTDKGLSNFERMKAVEAVIQEFSLKADTYNLDKITKGLNNELDKLKDEYELAIALDADPELGGVFMDVFQIDKNQYAELPRTWKRVAEKAQQAINNVFKENNVGDEFDILENLNDEHFKKWAEERGKEIDSGIMNGLKALVEHIKKIRKDESVNTEKEWNELVKKYGSLQAKLAKIYKDAVKSQTTIAKQFGTKEQQDKIFKLQAEVVASKDPSEIAALNEDVSAIIREIAENNPIAAKVIVATDNQTEQDSAKAYWEDFKNSDLYSMTFDDMANNATSSIRLIIVKLEELKDKVKENPVAMKELMKSLNDAESELRARNPFAAVVKGLKDWGVAAKEAKKAQEELNAKTGVRKQAQSKRDNAQRFYDESEDADNETRVVALENLADAENKLTKAVDEESQAEQNNTKKQNNKRKTIKEVSASITEAGKKIGELGDLVGQVGDIYSQLFTNPNEYDETAETIGDIATSIQGVGQAATGVGQIMSGDIINGVSGVLSGVTSAISAWSDNSNKRINAKIKESERAVKDLENAYKDLEVAINNAYGTNVIGAKRAALANKELQLAELQRQLELEKSRKSKDRDADKIKDLEGQIIDLRNEITSSSKEIVNDLLGISSVGDAAKSAMEAYVNALRSGENATKALKSSFKDMIANMIIDIYATKIIAPKLEKLVDDMEERINKRTEEQAKAYEEAKKKETETSTMSDKEIANKIRKDRGYDEAKERYKELLSKQYYDTEDVKREIAEQIGIDEHDVLQSDIRRWYKNLGNEISAAYEEMQRLGDVSSLDIEMYKRDIQRDVEKKQEELDKASTPEIYDLDLVAKEALEVAEELEQSSDGLKYILDRFEMLGDQSTKLSELQAGIQGITEDTAGALEAYMNIVSQKMFEQNDTLLQIRDIVQAFDFDIQTATMGQMLLQLQQSYIVQQSIESILKGVLNPSGRAFNVELLN